MKNVMPLLILLSVLTLFSCKNDAKKHMTDKEKAESLIDKTQTTISSFKTNPDSIKVHWTAYKTTERVGVKGTFTDVNIASPNGAPDLTTFLKGTSFKINTASVLTNDAGRDQLLVKFFFEQLVNKTEIAGQFVDVNGNDLIGKGNLMLHLNGLSKNLPFDYFIENKLLIILAQLNMEDWDGRQAMQSINEACELKHTGEDGISKTWPDVDVRVEVPLE